MHLNRLDKWGENGGECLFPSHSHQVTNTRDAKCPIAGAAPHLQTMSHHHPLTSSFQNSTKPSEHTLQGSSRSMQPQATHSATLAWGHKFINCWLWAPAAEATTSKLWRSGTFGCTMRQTKNGMITNCEQFHNAATQHIKQCKSK